MPRPPHYDISALLKLANTNMQEVGRKIGVSSDIAGSWGRRGIPDKYADRAACAFGFHPMLVWPEWMDYSILLLEGRQGVVRRKRRRYYSKNSDAMRARAREAYLKDPESRRAYRKAYYRKNREKELARQKAYDDAKRAAASVAA